MSRRLGARARARGRGRGRPGRGGGGLGGGGERGGGLEGWGGGWRWEGEGGTFVFGGVWGDDDGDGWVCREGGGMAVRCFFVMRKYVYIFTYICLGGFLIFFFIAGLCPFVEAPKRENDTLTC